MCLRAYASKHVSSCHNISWKGSITRIFKDLSSKSIFLFFCGCCCFCHTFFCMLNTYSGNKSISKTTLSSFEWNEYSLTNNMCFTYVDFKSYRTRFSSNWFHGPRYSLQSFNSFYSQSYHWHFRDFCGTLNPRKGFQSRKTRLVFTLFAWWCAKCFIV